MPDSSRLMPKRVCRSAVVAPATTPAPNAAAVASTGSPSATRSTAATAPPRVSEPSAVMSANSKIRKLMKTPRAISDRTSPIVKAPTSSSIEGLRRLPFPTQRREPARPAEELALADPRRPAVVDEEVQHAQRMLAFEEAGHGLLEVEEAVAEGAKAERDRVYVSPQAARPQGPELGDWPSVRTSDDTGEDGDRMNEGALGREAEPAPDPGIGEEIALCVADRRRAPQRRADEAGGLRNHHEPDGGRLRNLQAALEQPREPDRLLRARRLEPGEAAPLPLAREAVEHPHVGGKRARRHQIVG